MKLRDEEWRMNKLALDKIYMDLLGKLIAEHQGWLNEQMTSRGGELLRWHKENGVPVYVNAKFGQSFHVVE